MSSYMVSDRQLTILAAYAVEHCLSDVPAELRFDFNTRGAQAVISRVFDMLAVENQRSVCYRYNEPERDIDTIVIFEQKHILEARTVPALHIIKACHHYAYQSCEHPGWRESAARKLIHAIERTAVQHVPGYDDAPWGL